MKSLKNLTDGQLINLLHGDGEIAFGEVYDRYFDALARYAYKLTYGDDIAYDLVHDVFTNLWAKRTNLQDTYPNALRDYLYTAIKNAVLNDRRKAAYHEKNLADFIRYASSHPVPADERVISKQMQEDMDKEIAALPERMREIFLLRSEENLSHAEIAERLNISKLTVKTQINNAIRRLSKKFTPHFILLVYSILN